MLKKYFPVFLANEIRIFLNRVKYKDSFILSPYIDKKSVLRGNNKILREVEIYGSEIDKYSYINFNTVVSNSKIGKFTSIGSNCTIGAAKHPIDYLSTSPYTYSNSVKEISLNIFKFNSVFESYEKETLVGNDCWIGNNVIVMQGVEIGNGSIIGAGSIVTKNVPEYCIALGSPAKVIKKRFSDEKLKILQQRNLDNWWDLDVEQLMELNKYFNENSDWYKQ